MPQSSNHKLRRRTPWDNSMKRTASQQFLFEAYGDMYQQRHAALQETGEDALINAFVPETCPYCQSEHIKGSDKRATTYSAIGASTVKRHSRL